MEKLSLDERMDLIHGTVLKEIMDLAVITQLPGFNEETYLRDLDEEAREVYPPVEREFFRTVEKLRLSLLNYYFNGDFKTIPDCYNEWYAKEETLEKFVFLLNHYRDEKTGEVKLNED